MYDIPTPSGKTIRHPPKGWRFSLTTFRRELAAGKIVFSADETRIIRKIYLADQTGRVPETLWCPADVGTTREAKAEIRAFVPEDSFDTPKPERLLARVLELATNPGDLVLDSFAGSGTTGAVAHKMGRRWVMVELGEHCHTHVIPRLRKVIDGDDPGGVTEATGWKGGGGFRYYRLAPSLLEKDRFGNWVISKAYNPAMLAEALCKLHGFRYEPSEEVYWVHGRSSERDFLWVTTQTLTAERLQQLSDEVGPERSLMVCCGAFRGDRSRWGNLTIEKIPQSVLDRCEWGRDDYSLAVENLPSAPKVEESADVRAPRKVSSRQAERIAGQTSLFDDEGSEP
jgi:adenine-specific DNA-methyltransferase